MRGAGRSELAHAAPERDKVVLSGGLSFYVHRKVRLDGTIRYMCMTDLKVRDSAVRQPTSIHPASGTTTPLGNGDYQMDALYIGGGLTVLLQ